MKYQDENGEFKDIIVKASDTLPIGFIGLNPSDIVPYGWLECNGQQVLRADYPDLFKVIGTTYNVSNDLDDDKFRLPNFQGRVPVGQSGSDVDFVKVGSTGGEKKHKLTIEELPSFRAEIKTWRGSGDAGYPGILGVSEVDGVQTSTSKAEFVGGDQPHNIMQPYIVQNYIIKAKQTVAVVSKTVNEESTGNDKVYDVDYINKTFQKNEYSTEEKIVGSWMGSPIYRKVISIDANVFGDGSATDGTLLEIPHNLSNLDVIVNSDLIWFRTADLSGRKFPSVYYKDSEWNGSMQVNKNYLYIEAGSKLLNSLATQSTYIYAIIEYTKVVDEEIE